MPTAPDNFAAFLEELQKLGWSTGRNLIVERRYANGQNDRLPALAAELVATAPDVILTSTTPAVIALQKATAKIPIVAAAIANPVESGIVDSLSRPSANITGISSFASELSAKRLEFLKEIAPRIKRVAVIANPASPATAAALKELQVAAGKLGVTLAIVEMLRPENLEAALAQVTALRPDAFFMTNEPPFLPLRKRIAEFALAGKLPSAFGFRQHVEAGGLLAYAPNYVDLFRRAATYVDKILRGAKPTDLPIEQPTKLELVINIKTAKSLGLAVPQSLLVRANELIQ